MTTREILGRAERGCNSRHSTGSLCHICALLAITTAVVERDKKWSEAISLYVEGDTAIKAAILHFMEKVGSITAFAYVPSS